MTVTWEPSSLFWKSRNVVPDIFDLKSKEDIKIREKRSREKCCKGETSSGRNFFQPFTTASYLVNITTCCKCHFTLIFTTSDNISEDGVFIMSPLGVNVISYWLLQLVTIFKKMLSLVVRFTLSKVVKFHKNSQNNFQMSPHFVKSALNRECKHFTSSCHSWKFMTFTKCHHLL